MGWSERRRQALEIAAKLIKTNVEEAMLSLADEEEQPELEATLLQLAEELQAMAEKKPRTRRAHKQEEYKPYWLTIMAAEARDQPRQTYKTLQLAQMQAMRILNKENADPSHDSPAQRVWVYMDGPNGVAKVVFCCRANAGGAGDLGS